MCDKNKQRQRKKVKRERKEEAYRRDTGENKQKTKEPGIGKRGRRKEEGMKGREEKGKDEMEWRMKGVRRVSVGFILCHNHHEREKRVL